MPLHSCPFLSGSFIVRHLRSITHHARTMESCIAVHTAVHGPRFKMSGLCPVCTPRKTPPTPRGVLKGLIGVKDDKHNEIKPLRSQNVTKSRLRLCAEGQCLEPDLVQIWPFCTNLHVSCMHRKLPRKHLNPSYLHRILRIACLR